MLTPQQVGEAIIDVCPGCGGIWVDWFDGELGAMVRGAPSTARSGPRGKGGSGACPRCHCALSADRYLDAPEEIRRCGDCAGAFVPREAAHAIAALKTDPDEAPAGRWSRLAAVLRRWFGWEEKERR
ncbi:Hypothetical protein A7982_10164 [Minicystis rosea]|nr:Hypothetical protein A7982_10164 [Minicystis rosea]